MTTHVPHDEAAAHPQRMTATTVLSFVLEHYLLLPAGAAMALIWANTAPDGYFTVAHALRFPVNEIGMALFFALITQEVVEATMKGGVLHTWRRWILPVAGAAGAVAASGLFYLVYVEWNDQATLRRGWPVAGATDIAFGYFVMRAIFGRRHPAVPFLLLLAIAADTCGLIAVASRAPWVDVRPGGAVLMTAALGSAFLLRRQSVHTFWPYLLFSGPLSWWALYLDGYHPALALVPIVPFLPHAARSLDLFTDRPHGRHDSARHFEHVWQYPVQIVLFLFALTNAGVLVRGYDTGTWALLWAALAAKPAGILLAVAVTTALGFSLPARLHWRELIVAAFAASTGFTYALFFATSVYPPGPALNQIKMGALGTAAGLAVTFVVARLLRAGRFGPATRVPHAQARLGDYVL
jgi:NhaA family Na+:H+ antiporter